MNDRTVIAMVARYQEVVVPNRRFLEKVGDSPGEHAEQRQNQDTLLKIAGPNQVMYIIMLPPASL